MGGCVVQKRVAVYDIPGRCAHVNDCCRARKRVWYKADGRELVRSKLGAVDGRRAHHSSRSGRALVTARPDSPAAH